MTQPAASLTDPVALPCADATGRKPFPWRWLAAGLLLLNCLHLVVLTRDVRVTNDDDVRFQAVMREARPQPAGEFFAALSRTEARFYFATAIFPLPFTVHLIGPAWLFATARIGMLAAQLGLFAWLLARLCRNEAAGWLYATAALAALHIPALFYPVLSAATAVAGTVLFFASLHCFLTYARGGGPAFLFGAGAAFLGSLLYHENFLAGLVLFPALAWADQPTRRWPEALRLAWVFLPVAAAYLVVYLRFKQLNPSDYAGTVVAFNFAEAFQAWFRQTVSSFPGFELLRAHATPYPNQGPFWKSASEYAGLFRSLTAPDLALAVASAGLAGWLVRRTASGPWAGGRVNLVLLLAIALPNLLPALTAKYQLNAHHRFYPYVYGFTAYCWLIGAAIGSLAPAAGRAALRSPVMQIAVIAGAFGVFLSAQLSNRDVLGLLRLWFN